MIVSFDKSFLFVHVPKTGGTSMRCVLAAHAHDADKFWTNRLLNAVGIPINYCLGDYRHYRFRIHDPIRRAEKAYPPEVFERLFKFAFVRNPWDLLVSYRNFICAKPEHKRHRRVVRLSFEEYLEFAIAKGIGRQRPHLTDRNGRLLMNFVGRFENLQQDFQYVAQRLQIATKLPHTNRSKGRDYREYYTPRTRNWVQDAYGDEIAALGYDFEGTQRRAA
jgi:hypothetical protein